jgi:hypothetical protein
MSMPLIRRSVGLILIAAALSAFPLASPGFAQSRGGAGLTPEEIEAMVPPVDRSESTKAREELVAARLALIRSQSAVASNSRAIDTQMRSTASYKSVEIEVQRARTRYEAIQKPILDALMKDEEYAKLNQEAETARQIIAQLVAEQKKDFLDLLPHAKAALEAGRRMTRAEVIALALDPAVEEARMDMVTAYNKLRKLTSAFRREASRGESVRIATQDLEAARARVEAASAALAAALERETEADRVRDKQIEQIRTTGRAPNYPDEPRRKKTTDGTDTPKTPGDTAKKPGETTDK